LGITKGVRRVRALPGVSGSEKLLSEMRRKCLTVQTRGRGEGEGVGGL